MSWLGFATLVLVAAPAVILGLVWLVVMLELGGDRPEHEITTWW